MTPEITLPQAASRLGLPWHAANKLAMKGELGAVRQIANRWLIEEAGVVAYLARRHLQRLEIAGASPAATGTR